MVDETSPVYPKVAANAINRHKERGHYEEETVHSIVNSTPVAHVSFIPDPSNPAPVVLPMIARIGQFPGSEEAALYIHGYISTRMFRPRSSPEEEGFPVCVAATKIVNLVLALTPFSHSYDYRSAVVHGHALPLDPATDHDEIIFAMQLITDGMVSERWENSRTPPNSAEITSTRILKVRIDSASAKIRDSGVKDDAKDLKNEETTAKVWTGVIPYMETLGTPVPAATNRVATVPAYIQEHVRAHNDTALEVAGQSSGTGMVSKVIGSIFGRS